MDAKLTKLAFTKQAIVNLRNPKYKGLHTVFSGFNDAFRTYFEGDTTGNDPVAFTKEAVKAGELESRPAFRGAMIYLKGEAPQSEAAKNALKKMGL